MKKIFSICIVIFVANIIFAQHENCNHGDAPSIEVVPNGKYIHATHAALESIGLTLADVKKKNFENTITSIGRIENIPENVYSVTSRISGKVTELYISKDSFVKKGDSICKIESFLAGNPPPSVVLKTLKSGIVESLDVVNGSGVDSGKELARIADTSNFYAVANVYESSVRHLKKGDKARIKIEAIDDIVEGTLVKFGSVLNTETNTLSVYFLIENKDGKIKNGMRAVFSIITSSKSAMTVPNESISDENGWKYVYVQSKESPHIFEQRLVTVGEQNDIETEIINGVHIGEKVALNGIYQLRFMPRNNDPHDHSHEDSENAHNKISKDSHEHSEHEDEHRDELEHSDSLSHNHDYHWNLICIALAVSLVMNVIFTVAFEISRRRKK